MLAVSTMHHVLFIAFKTQRSVEVVAATASGSKEKLENYHKPPEYVTVYSSCYFQRLCCLFQGSPTLTAKVVVSIGTGRYTSEPSNEEASIYGWRHPSDLFRSVFGAIEIIKIFAEQVL